MPLDSRQTVSYLKAEKRVKEVKSFYRFLFIFVSISMFLMLLNFFTDRHEFWSIFPILVLALPVAFKYARVFGWPGFSKEWEERKFYEELEKIKDREDRIQAMLSREKQTRIQSNGQSTTPSPTKHLPEDIDKLELKELRKNWKDSDFV